MRSSSVNRIAAGWTALLLVGGATALPQRHIEAVPIHRRGGRSGSFVGSLGRRDDTPSSSSSLRDDDDGNNRGFVLSIPRGGAVSSSSSCGDSDLSLALKVGVSSFAEAAGLLAVLWGAERLSSEEGEQAAPAAFSFLLRATVGGLSALQWISLFVTVFCSSAVKSLIDGGVGAASRQALRPDAVPGDEAWYGSLSKPPWNPPGWLFPIMWLVVSKPTQFWAVGRVLRQGREVSGSSAATYWPALAVYCLHLSLGDAWNQVFFGCQRIHLGAVVILAFWSLLAASCVLLGSVDRTAGFLLLPTLGWVTVASALNWEIYRLNK